MALFPKHPLLSLLLAACVLTACGYVRDVPGSITAENWQVLFDQTEDPDAAVKAGGWQPLIIPSKFKLPYKPKRGYQYAWLKATLRVAGDRADYYGIHLGRVYYLDRVYVNGRLVRERLARDMVSMHFPRNYTLPASVLSNGANTILVRLGVYGIKYGGITDPVLLLTKESFKKIRRYDEFIYHHCPLAIAVALFCQVVFFIIFFAWSRSMEMLLVTIYYTLACALIVSDMFGSGLFGHDIRLTFKDAILTCLPVIFMFIIQSFYRVYIPKFNVCMGMSLAVAMVATFINFDTTSSWYLAETISIGTMILALPACLFSLAYSHSVRPDRTKLVLILVLILPPAGRVMEELISHYFMKGLAEYSGVGFLMIQMVAIMALLSRNIIRREIGLRVLYHNLKARVAVPLKRPSPEKDDRIDAVIEFIKKNFTSEISREGLAASVGVSADYLSKRFNAVTGKRIDEYIHELRVGAAAEQLRATDRTIITIAFSVGFDSMSTFNRIFLKYMGTSPKNYRQNNMAETA